MKPKQLKILGIVVFVILFANLILFAMGFYSDVIFWVIIGLGALFVYKVLPKLKEK